MMKCFDRIAMSNGNKKLNQKEYEKLIKLLSQRKQNKEKEIPLKTVISALEELDLLEELEDNDFKAIQENASNDISQKKKNSSLINKIKFFLGLAVLGALVYTGIQWYPKITSLTNTKEETDNANSTNTTNNKTNSTLTPSESISSEATTWRSNSGKTRILKLNQICWGNGSLHSVQTVFGSSPYSGVIKMNTIQTQGCSPGDTLSGQFNLYQNQNNCKGLVTIMWKSNNRAFLEWDINNLSECSASQPHWEITTYPVKENSGKNSGISSQGVATVFDPPSNVRATPNGEIICSVREVMNIDLYSSVQQDWYRTDVCGEMGYIHNSQIRF